jgi:hypothetical protein
MASVKQSASNESTGASQLLYRVSYVDAVVRETFVSAHNENEAEDIVEAQIAEALHHHAIDAYHDDMQAEPATTSGRPHMCFECGQTTGPDLSPAR